MRQKRVTDILRMISVKKISFFSKRLTFFATDDRVVKKQLCVQKSQRGRDDPVPKKTGTFLPNRMKVIYIASVDRFRSNDRRGKFIILFILIVNDLSFFQWSFLHFLSKKHENQRTRFIIPYFIAFVNLNVKKT